ncbi:transporter [Bacillus sp. FJAT-27225]|uniref:DMT family transporter n=1 Tax=Bacillus sp. FJAT-27225 TaxID=1743144 RepID=UPI00080C32A7|nr:multidrug efflux SMR transporter [Bacillus sp. FJAT-27225]OCA85800.1 transporter [Bacillus sp. FJAT-27225]
MAWLALIFAGLLEMFGVAMMNRVNQKRDLLSLILLAIGFSGSFFLLSYAMKTVPMGTAYAIWTGIGASGGAIIGMLFYGESKDWKRITFITIILASAVGLKLVS